MNVGRTAVQRVRTPPAPPLDGVAAVVLTFMRPRFAGDVTVVRSLESRASRRAVVVVVNGSAASMIPRWSRRSRWSGWPRNTRSGRGVPSWDGDGIREPSTRWAYLCEDDVGLFTLPTPRVRDVIAQIADRGPSGTDLRRCGRRLWARFVGRGAHTDNVRAPARRPVGLTPVEWPAGGPPWCRERWSKPGPPRPQWFFGLEDFDFFCRVREAGFGVLVDERAARAGGHPADLGRDETLQSATERPNDTDEAWRAYYHAGTRSR